MPADITLLNLNMLFMRYAQEIERELHVPLGCLYLAKAIEEAGFTCDFRDYQMCPSDTPFDMDVFVKFMSEPEPAPVIGLSCMANLLPFTILAARALKERWPDRTIVLGGVGPKGAEETILRRFPWVDIVARGEGELTAVDLLKALSPSRRTCSLPVRVSPVSDLSAVAGISWRRNNNLDHGQDARGTHGRDAHATETARHGQDARGTHGQDAHATAEDAHATVIANPDRRRIEDLDAIGFPAWEKVDLSRYVGYGMMTSRGCPYKCTFCSVAPVWNHQSSSRSPRSIVDEMEVLHKNAGVNLFLFQDEFFVSGKEHVMDFCRELVHRSMTVNWKAFGRVNLMDVEMMRAMADSGCLELRFGVESGSDRILKMIKKGFTAAQTMEVVPPAIEIFPRVDTFYVWGFPFETLEDFNQSLFQMVSFRMMGARILPSLLSLLPQTEVYRQCASQYTLEFCPFLLPEFVFTGHEIADAGEMDIPPQYQGYFRLITDNPDIFPGFFHVDLKNNVLPKLQLLRQFGFYPAGKGEGDTDPKITNVQ